jgi:hypothetical protein
MLAPGRFLELIRDRRDIAAAVANATTALTHELSATNQQFVFILLISSFCRSAFQNLNHSELLQFGPACFAKGAQRIDRVAIHHLVQFS